MLQNPCKAFGFKKNMVSRGAGGGGGGKPYPASGLSCMFLIFYLVSIAEQVVLSLTQSDAPQTDIGISDNEHLSYTFISYAILGFRAASFSKKQNRSLLQQGISEPVFYGDLDHKFKRIVVKPSFPSQLKDHQAL